VDASTTRPPLLSRRARFASGRFGGVPAAPSAVAGLPETTVTAGGNGENTCCARGVCLEGYEAVRCPPRRRRTPAAAAQHQ